MALFNYATRELSAKIVYYGPGLSGKTTNIEMIHKMLRPSQKGRLISLPTETDRTLFFDFLPVDLGQIKGFKVRFHLYTVPGQVFYNATRRLVLQGVDGVVFVADSQRDMVGSNMESLKNLIDNLSSYGKKLEELPFVLQYNKRDLKNIMTMQEMDVELNHMKVPTYEAVAPMGKGVTETLVAISRLVFSHLRKTLLMPGEIDSKTVEKPLEENIIKGPVKPKPQLKSKPKPKLLSEAEFEVETEPEPAPEPEFRVLPESHQPQEFEPLPGLETEPEPGHESGFEPEPLPNLESSRAEPPEPDQTTEYIDVSDIDDVEEQEVNFGPISLQAVKSDPSPAHRPAAQVHKLSPVVHEIEEMDEVEVEFPELFQEPERAMGVVTPLVSVDAEGAELTFTRFEAPFLAPDGRAVIPALFIDGAGNSVRIRIHIAVDKERS